MADTGKRPCKCGCGTLVTRTYAKGHWAKAQSARRPEPIPGPADPDPFDIGEIPAGGEAEPEPEPRFAVDSEGETEEIPEDAAPGHLAAAPAPRTRKGGPRVTATLRKDIDAKLGIMLLIPARIWQARDPICGGTFTAQLPDIRAAMVELVCQSADLVDWFTGVGGGFMLWLNLAAACQPVAVMVWAHHVAHSVGEEGREALDLARYAA